jgi:RNase H-fold protein (predicted Holliday junction resolvase)
MDEFEKEVIRIALDAGFSISTAYGQDLNKLMPISDIKTLASFAKKIQKETTHDFLRKKKPNKEIISLKKEFAYKEKQLEEANVTIQELITKLYKEQEELKAKALTLREALESVVLWHTSQKLSGVLPFPKEQIRQALIKWDKDE